MLAESADARRDEVDNFPRNGDLSKREDLYGDLGYASEFRNSVTHTGPWETNSTRMQREVLSVLVSSLATPVSRSMYVTWIGRALLDPRKTEASLLLFLTYFYMVSSSRFELRGHRLPTGRWQPRSASWATGIPLCTYPATLLYSVAVSETTLLITDRNPAVTA